MKIFKEKVSVVVIVLCCVLRLDGMINAPLDKPSFFTASIGDIQNFVDTHQKYPPVMDVKNLVMLGLNFNNSPLDVRYHYDLLKKKLKEKNDDFLYEISNTVELAYTQIKYLFSLYDAYVNEFSILFKMSFDQVESMELKNKDDVNLFLNDTNKILNNVINKEHQLHSKIRITELLGLPNATEYSLIHKTYIYYVKRNDPYRLIALKAMDEISSEELDKKMLRVKRDGNFNERMLRLEEIKKAYADYIQSIK